MIAYYPLPQQYWRDKLMGAPEWADDPYDIEAKVAPGDIAAWQHQGPNNEMFRSMLQAVLRDRCRLQIHTSSVASPVYQLVVSKKGPKGLVVRQGNVPLPPNSLRLPTADGQIIPNPDVVRVFGMSMASLAAFLTSSAGLPVIDETRLAGLYDFSLPRLKDSSDVTLAGERSFDISSLGLELKRVTGQIPVLTIDHLERPSPN